MKDTKGLLAILLMLPATLAALLDDPPPAPQPPFNCTLEILPPRDRCPGQYHRVLRSLEKRRQPSGSDQIEDRIERLEREIKDLLR